MKRNVVNTCRLRFPSLSRNEGFARSAVAAFAAGADPTAAAVAELKTAVSEAVTNAIVHGYRDSKGTVELTLKLFDDGVMYISVKDNGRGIEDIDRAMQPSFTTAKDDEERSGLGFTVMMSFTDKLRVRSTPGRGTTVVMEKNLMTDDS